MNLLAVLRRIRARPLAKTLRAVFARVLPREAAAKAAPRAPAGLAPHPIDLAYGIDTAKSPADKVKSGSSADAYNVGYGPSGISIARKAIEAVPELDWATFVDFGCGKGRILALATEYPFAKVVGLELSPSLCAEARAVAAAVAARHPQRTPIEIVEGDGLAYALPSGRIVMYLYHPAYQGLLQRLAKSLVQHQTADPANKVFIIYYNPAAAAAFDKTRGLKRFYAAAHRLDEDDLRSNPYGNEEDSVVLWQTLSEHMYPAYPGADAPIRVTAFGDGGSVISADN
jgi:SAM-dependent methyltransferase